MVLGLCFVIACDAGSFDWYNLHCYVMLSLLHGFLIYVVSQQRRFSIVDHWNSKYLHLHLLLDLCI